MKEFKLRVIEEKNNIQNVDSKGRDLRLRINIDGEKPKDLKDPPQFHIRYVLFMIQYEISVSVPGSKNSHG